MAINLNKHRDALQAAWKDVLDDKTPTDWALFGYEGQTNDLKVVSKGAGGIEEMVDDLNSGKIMYAFCRVLDPKTSLPKCVLINWQGEGAPLVRKGTCANHVRDVANFFKGAHVTLNARNEEEVDPELIIDKVAKSTGSAYSFKERTEHVERTGPVGTTYKKVVPTQEINSKERDKFWEKEEQEEKQRQEEERKRKEEERLRLENERKQRELAEAEQREERSQERNRSINQLREAERTAENANLSSAPSTEDELAEREREEMERRNRSELLRRQRSQEAQHLISQRTFDARAVFEQNTSAGQMHNRRQSASAVRPLDQGWPPAQAVQHAPQPVVQPEAQPVVEPVVQPAPQPVVQPEPAYEPEHRVEPPHLEETVPAPVHYNTPPSQEVPAPQTDNIANYVDHNEQNNVWTDISNNPELLTSAEDSALFDPSLTPNGNLRARALYDYQAADQTEITFDPGDIISHIDQIDEGWWQGLGPDGTFGLFPANYVELID